MKRATILSTGVALILLAALIGRMLWGAHAEYQYAVAAAEQGQRDDEVRYLRRTMAYYLPGNPWVRQAHARLITLAQAAEQAGNKKNALFIWQELRSAILALRSTYQPFAADLTQINQRIATLTMGIEKNTQQPIGTTEAALLTRLNNPPEPIVLWTIIGLAGYILWLVSCGFLIARGVSPKGFVTAYFTQHFLLMMISFALFILGMALA